MPKIYADELMADRAFGLEKALQVKPPARNARYEEFTKRPPGKDKGAGGKSARTAKTRTGQTLSGELAALKPRSKRVVGQAVAGDPNDASRLRGMLEGGSLVGDMPRDPTGVAPDWTQNVAAQLRPLGATPQQLVGAGLAALAPFTGGGSLAIPGAIGGLGGAMAFDPNANMEDVLTGGAVGAGLGVLGEFAAPRVAPLMQRMMPSNEALVAREAGMPMSMPMSMSEPFPNNVAGASQVQPLPPSNLFQRPAIDPRVSNYGGSFTPTQPMQPPAPTMNLGMADDALIQNQPVQGLAPPQAMQPMNTMREPLPRQNNFSQFDTGIQPQPQMRPPAMQPTQVLNAPDMQALPWQAEAAQGLGQTQTMMPPAMGQPMAPPAPGASEWMRFNQMRPEEQLALLMTALGIPAGGFVGYEAGQTLMQPPPPMPQRQPIEAIPLPRAIQR